MGYKVECLEMRISTFGNTEMDSIIKCNNNYQMISNRSFTSKNTLSYLAPNTSQYLTVPHSTSIDQFLTVFNVELEMNAFTQSNPEYIQERNGKLADMLRYCFKIKQTI
ncbi:hypothetical protein O5D80_001851 [Batrachochytrium dendrobatidis]|nr:hypothetical protein O5D80_001851 [Batrachochytrium dendrobatidis]